MAEEIETGGDFSSLFWMQLCFLIEGELKTDVGQMTVNRVAVMQSSEIIAALSNYTRKRASEEVIQAAYNQMFAFIDERMSKAPWYFSVADIMRFKGPNDKRIEELCSVVQINDWIAERGRLREDGHAPSLCVYPGTATEKLIIKKEFVIPLCQRLIKEYDHVLNKTIVTRWLKIMKKWQVELAMQSDESYEELLGQIFESGQPLLHMLLISPLTGVVYLDRKNIQAVDPPIFDAAGRRLAWSKIFELERKEMYWEVRRMLPFWYHIPIISWILGLLRRGGKKYVSEVAKPTVVPVINPEPAARVKVDIFTAYNRELVPSGIKPEIYLKFIQQKWPAELRQSLDVLVKSRARKWCQLNRHKEVTRTDIDDLAQSIFEEAKGVKRMDGKDVVVLCIKLILIANIPLYMKNG
jgi:hypothetical protein